VAARQCAEDRDPHNGQRLVDITDLPEKPRIRAAAAAQGVVRIDWEDDERGACFELDWLAAHAFGGGQRRPELAPRTWLGGAGLLATRTSPGRALPRRRGDSRVRLTWLTRCCRTAGLPEWRAGAGNGAARGDSFGRARARDQLRLTFDVRSVPQPENLAYTDLGLGLHTDNPYRDPVRDFRRCTP